MRTLFVMFRPYLKYDKRKQYTTILLQQESIFIHSTQHFTINECKC